MNCCDASVRCHNGAGCPARSTGTPLRFAPGAIEHHRRPAFGTREQRRELRRWIGYLVVAMVLCGLAMAAGGFIAGVGYSLRGGV